MKDAYSFDRDVAGMQQSYQFMYDAYVRIFNRFGLQFRAVAADGKPRTGAVTAETEKLVAQELRRQGHVVAMVGDGINDSPALSFADVGIAMKHGAQVAHESANIVLMEDNLWKLVQALEIARAGVSLIKQNYIIVALMNTVALALALPGGLITPQVTALISNGSAIIASLNAVRPMLRY